MARRGPRPALQPGFELDDARAVAAPGSAPESAIPVSELTKAAKDIIEGAFPPLWVWGEVGKFTQHRNGHWYFSLKDAASVIECVVWATEQYRIPAPPEEGMQVAARGQLTLWNKMGKMQFVVSRIEAEGEGLWRKAFDKTKAALEAEGLLDPARKRPIPRFPRRVAVVTSADGAAFRDIVSVIQRRDRTVEIVIIPAMVQGQTAPASLVKALERAGRWGGADVLIVGRGGGSREELWCFNDEKVARAIAACPIPTISAVGHEVDVTIADFVADYRAATPSAAAEAAVPVYDEVLQMLRGLGVIMRDGLSSVAQEARIELRRLSRELVVRAERTVERRRASIQAVAGRIDALSPLATLARGYSIARTPEGQTLSRAAAFSAGKAFELLLQDGRVDATVAAVHEDAN